MRLTEQYRPKTYSEFVGQEKAVTKLRKLIERDTFDGDSFWIVGPSGSGKTTLAWIVARQLAKHDIDICELDGEACTIDAVREASRMMQYSSMSGGQRIWIINEAQAMTNKAIQAWLTILDKIPANVTIIFTTTADSADLFGEYDGPFRSRCKTISLTTQGQAPLIAQRVREIAQAEGLNGKPETAYLDLIKRCRNNFRAALQAVESGDMLLDQ